VVSVALDTGGAEAAGPWIDLAKAEHPSLIDEAHLLDELLGIVNVPSGVWIDEQGTIVRPPEPAVPRCMDSASDVSCATRLARPIRFLDHPGRLPFRVYRDEAGRLLRTVVRAVAVPRKSQ